MKLRNKLIESNISTLNSQELQQSVANQVNSLIAKIKHPNETVNKKYKTISTNKGTMYEPFFNECHFQNPITNVVLKKEQEFISKEKYNLSDFTNYNGVEFLTNAYIGILKRKPEPGGLSLHLKVLDRCLYANSKILILGGLRFSKEGKLFKTKISGLKRHYVSSMLFRVPVLGYIFKSITTLINLPKIIEKNHYLEKKIAELLKTCETNDFKLQQAISTKAAHEDLVNNIKHVVFETQSNFNILNSKVTKCSDQQLLTLYHKLLKRTNIKDFTDFKSITENNSNHVVHEELAKNLFRDEMQQLRRDIVTSLDEKVRTIEFLKFKKEIDRKLHNLIDPNKEG